MKKLMAWLVPTRIEPTLQDLAELAFTRMVRDNQLRRYRRLAPHCDSWEWFDPWRAGPWIRLR